MNNSEYWDKRAAGYQGHMNKRHIRRRFAVQEAFLREHLGTPKKVLEVGCGTGRILEVVKAELPKAKIVGVDASEGMLALANALDTLSEVTLTVADALELPYKNKAFDLVLSFEVLLHLTKEQAAKALKEMKRVASRAIVYTYGGENVANPYCFAHNYPALFAKAGWKVIATDLNAIDEQAGYVLEAK